MAQVQSEGDMNIGDSSDREEVLTELDENNDHRGDDLEELQTQPLPPDENTAVDVGTGGGGQECSVFDDADNSLDDSDDFVDTKQTISRTATKVVSSLPLPPATITTAGSTANDGVAAGFASSSSRVIVNSEHNAPVERKPYQSTNYMEGSSDEGTECPICLLSFCTP